MDFVDLDKVLDEFEEEEKHALSIVPGQELKPSGYLEFLQKHQEQEWTLMNSGTSAPSSGSSLEHSWIQAPVALSYDVPYDSCLDTWGRLTESQLDSLTQLNSVAHQRLSHNISVSNQSRKGQSAIVTNLTRISTDAHDVGVVYTTDEKVWDRKGIANCSERKGTIACQSMEVQTDALSPASEEKLMSSLCPLSDILVDGHDQTQLAPEWTYHTMSDHSHISTNGLAARGCMPHSSLLLDLPSSRGHHGPEQDVALSDTGQEANKEGNFDQPDQPVMDSASVPQLPASEDPVLPSPSPTANSADVAQVDTLALLKQKQLEVIWGYGVQESGLPGSVQGAGLSSQQEQTVEELKLAQCWTDHSFPWELKSGDKPAVSQNAGLPVIVSGHYDLDMPNLEHQNTAQTMVPSQIEDTQNPVITSLVEDTHNSVIMNNVKISSVVTSIVGDINNSVIASHVEETPNSVLPSCVGDAPDFSSVTSHVEDTPNSSVITGSVEDIPNSSVITSSVENSLHSSVIQPSSINDKPVTSVLTTHTSVNSSTANTDSLLDSKLAHVEVSSNNSGEDSLSSNFSHVIDNEWKHVSHELESSSETGHSINHVVNRSQKDANLQGDADNWSDSMGPVWSDIERQQRLTVYRSLMTGQLEIEMILEEVDQSSKFKVSEIGERLLQGRMEIEDILDEISQAKIDTEDILDEVVQAQIDTQDILDGVGQAQIDAQDILYGVGQAQIDTGDILCEVGQAQIDTGDILCEVGQAQIDTEDILDEVVQAQIDTEDILDKVVQAQIDTQDILGLKKNQQPESIQNVSSLANDSVPKTNPEADLLSNHIDALGLAQESSSSTLEFLGTGARPVARPKDSSGTVARPKDLSGTVARPKDLSGLKTSQPHSLLELSRVGLHQSGTTAAQQDSDRRAAYPAAESSSAHQTSDSSAARKTSDSLAAHQASDSFAARQTLDSSPAHQTLDSSAAHQTSDSSPAHQTLDSSAAHQILDSSTAHQASDSSVVHQDLDIPILSGPIIEMKQSCLVSAAAVEESDRNSQQVGAEVASTHVVMDPDPEGCIQSSSQNRDLVQEEPNQDLAGQDVNLEDQELARQDVDLEEQELAGQDVDLEEQELARQDVDLEEQEMARQDVDPEDQELAGQDVDSEGQKLAGPTRIRLGAERQGDGSFNPAENVEVAEQADDTLASVEKADEMKGPAATANTDLASYTQDNIGVVAPFWIPDAEALACMICQTRFTVWKRRHHCRACGKVLCAVCCNQKAMLPYLDYKEARVCIDCHIWLHNGPMAGSPNPNKPNGYCPKLPPSQQAGQVDSPPVVMVPTGILSSSGSQKGAGQGKQVMFSDGIRPGSEQTSLDTTAELATDARLSDRSSRRHKASSKVQKMKVSSLQRCRSLISANGWPPVCTYNTVTGCTEIDRNRSQPENFNKSDEKHSVTYAVNPNLRISVNILNMDCCMNKKCWCFVTKGMDTAGQPELVVLVELTLQELIDSFPQPPLDIFQYFQSIYEESLKGNNIQDLGHFVFQDGRPDSAGFLFVQSSFQCLNHLQLPSSPFLFGILIHKLELPWARVFPLRLMLRLGAESRYYPCSLVSDRHRKSVFQEVGHTIIQLLADLRSYQYMLPQTPGLVVHMEAHRTLVCLPRNRYCEVVRAVRSSNEHVLALGAWFSREVDSHLVCIQTETGNYQTQAINIQDRPRLVTGASFIVFNGSLKASQGLRAKSSVVEDGLMVQVLPEELASLKEAIKNMTDFVIRCGPVLEQDGSDLETVEMRWVEDDKHFNMGATSVIDGASLEGVRMMVVKSPSDYLSDRLAIRWTQVFFLQYPDSVSSHFDPLDIGQLLEDIAHASCTALVKHLDELRKTGYIKLGLRVNLIRDSVDYEVGSQAGLLPVNLLNLLDTFLVPVVHQTSEDGLILEFVFHILD